jgi:hypothetical protein
MSYQQKIEQEVAPTNVVNGRTRGVVMVQYGKIKDMNREFDIAFWQAQSAEARLRAGWELVEDYYAMKGLPKDELRLQRTVRTLQRQSS